MRKLAYIAKINEIDHMQADNLELAIVGNWQAVVKKGQFQKGELVVFVEADAMLPDKPEFDFMKKNGKMQPVKYHKIRGAVSQGLVFPVSILGGIQIEEGMDLTVLMDIEKYDPEECNPPSDGIVGPIPEIIEKTNEERIQTYKLLHLLGGYTLLATEKVNGTSFTCYIYRGKVYICSHFSIIDKNSNNIYTYVYKKYCLEKKMLQLRQFLPFDFAIQCELYGYKKEYGGVQGNPYHINDLNIALFNIIDIDTGCHYEPEGSPIDTLGIKTVPKIAEIDIPQGLSDTDIINMLKPYASGKSYLNNRVNREGVVFRAADISYYNIMGENTDLTCSRISFKILNPDDLVEAKVGSKVYLHKSKHSDSLLAIAWKKVSRKLKKVFRKAGKQ